MVEDREHDRLSEDYGCRFIDYGGWCPIVCACGICSFVSFISYGAHDFGCRHYRSPGGGQSLRDRTRQTRNGIKPIESDPGFQLARHYPGADARGNTHLERSAIGNRTVAPAFASSLTGLS